MMFLSASILKKGSNTTNLLAPRVARSSQAFTATSAQNHGHLGTFHSHHIFRYDHFTATFEAEIHLKAENIFSLSLILLSIKIILLSMKLKGDGR